MPMEIPAPPSKAPEYVRKYYREHYTTICAAVPRPFKEEFRRACQNAGTTMHNAIAEFAAAFIAEHTE